MPALAVWTTIAWVVATSILLYTISTVALTFYLMICCFVTFLCPLWMVKLQRLKKSVIQLMHNIHMTDT